MRPWAWLAVLVVVAHVASIAWLHWPLKWPPLVAALCWGAGAFGSLEPSPTSSPRHKDVAAAERTSIGRALLYREGWIVHSAPLALVLLAVVSLGFGAAAWWLHRPGPLRLVLAWSPALLVGAGWLASRLVNMWIVSGPALGFWLLFVVVSAAAGDTMASLRIAFALPAAVAAVFCVDLLRGYRRAASQEKK